MQEKIYGLLGRKLGHSYSVPIHHAMGNPHYRLYELEPEELECFVQRTSIAGLNVTIPYKVDVMAFCDEISPEAQSIGAVNTLVRRKGRLIGFNTDKAGFDYMLRRGGIDIRGKDVLILGTGGASRTAVYCAQQARAKSIVTVSHQDNTPSYLSGLRDTQILINTTPVGMYPRNGQSPADLTLFPHLEGVVDVIYNPIRTALMIQAENLGIPCVGGLEMLTAQAKYADELFFDRRDPEEWIENTTQMLLADNLNLVLIGMPGCGKSTVGQILGDMTARTVFEVDALIEEEIGMSIPDYFAANGEEAFRRVETRILEACGKQSRSIIVCGGGVVTRERNYPLLHQNGRIIEITRPLELLDRSGRPLSATPEALRKMAAVRAPMYARFRDIQVANDTTPQQTAQTIRRLCV